MQNFHDREKSANCFSLLLFPSFCFRIAVVPWRPFKIIPQGENLMAVLPVSVAESETSRTLVRAGLTRIHQGKVRDTWGLDPGGALRLVVATDRISIFDLVLPVLVPRKGEVLTALTHFWLSGPLKDFPHHLVRSEENPKLNMVHDVREVIPDLPRERCLVVQTVEIPPFEMTFRHHIGGSVWRAYEDHGVVAGHKLPPGLKRWQFLESPLFTPSTKAQKGHDVNVTVEAYLEVMGERGMRAIRMFMHAYTTAYEYAKERGILILDTKFEGLDVIADEVLTPDSSRFTTVEDFAAAMEVGRDPVFFDKEPVREFGRSVDTPWGKGIQRLDPTDLQHLSFVASLTIPDAVVSATTARYLDIFQRVVGISLSEYQRTEMGIA